MSTPKLNTVCYEDAIVNNAVFGIQEADAIVAEFLNVFKGDVSVYDAVDRAVDGGIPVGFFRTDEFQVHRTRGLHPRPGILFPGGIIPSRFFPIPVLTCRLLLPVVLPNTTRCRACVCRVRSVASSSLSVAIRFARLS